MTEFVELVEHVIDSLNPGETVANTFLDLSMAFNCLDHCTVIRKLCLLGIIESALHRFESYLPDRNQVVELKQLRNEKITYFFPER